jgi:hypothetical protein
MLVNSYFWHWSLVYWNFQGKLQHLFYISPDSSNP